MISETTNNVRNVQLVNQIPQPEWCFTLIFNYSGTLMLTGCGKEIVIWRFEKGQMNEQSRLKGHEQDVTSLAISKNSDWIVSSGVDNCLRFWKQQEKNQEWICLQNLSKINRINCLLIDKENERLVSSSGDNFIVVWKVNNQINGLNQEQILQDTGQCNHTYCLSYNQSQTFLVSCSLDKYIRIWSITGKNYEFFNRILLDDFGYRIIFINDYQIVWQQQNKGITHLLQIEDGKLIEKGDMAIELNKGQKDNSQLFPSVFNKEKKILIQKFNQFVYILKMQKDGSFKLAYEPIDCKHFINFGTLSQNGEYLVIWEQKTQQFKIYNIQYEDELSFLHQYL